jgi:hypothetical protein
MPSYPYYTEPTHDQGAITNVSGNAARDTAISNAEGRLIVDAVDKVFLLEPNKHPLVTLLNQVQASDGAYKGSRIMKASTGNPEFKWFEDVYGGRYAKVATGAAAGAASFDVSGAGSSSAHIFTVGDVVKVARTGENVLVTAITDTDTIAVTRSVGDTPAAAVVAGDGLFIVGNASEENALARNANTTRSTAQSNYTQIFKTTIALSGTEDAAKLYGGRDLPYLRSKKATEHALDIERAFWWGEKGSDTSGTQGHPRRFTGGVLEFIEGGNSYIQNQGGALTAPDLNTFLREGFTYGNSTKMLFAGGVLLQAINEIARGQIQTNVGDTVYGIKVSTWMTAFGEVKIVHNPLFVEDYAGYGFLLDMECFKYRYMDGRDTKLMTNIQAPDADGIIDQYLTECGLQRMQAPRHAIIKGVTA